MLKNFTHHGAYNLSYGDYNQDYKDTLVVFHGLMGTAKQDSFASFLKSKKIRLIIIARCGYGESDFYPLKDYMDFANIVKELMDSLAIKKFTVLGVSAGAPHAYAIAVLMKERVKQVCIYSGVGALYLKEVLLSYENYMKIKMMTYFIKLVNAKRVGKYFYKSIMSDFSDEQKKQDFVVDSSKNNAHGLGQEVKLEFSYWGFDLKDIEQKIYLKHSRADAGVPIESARITTKYLKNFELLEVENEEHFEEKSLMNFIDYISKKAEI